MAFVWLSFFYATVKSFCPELVGEKGFWLGISLFRWGAALLSRSTSVGPNAHYVNFGLVAKVVAGLGWALLCCW
jgi:hypothetical protein